MTATNDRLGLSAFRQLALGTGGWRTTFQTAMDALNDRLTLLSTRTATGVQGNTQAHFVGQHCISTDDELLTAKTVGAATAALWTRRQKFDPQLAALAALSPTGNHLPMFSAATAATLLAFKDEDNMASDSATALPSQQSVKAYVDAEIASIPAPITLESVVAVASGTSVTLSNTIPATANLIIINFEEISTNSGSLPTLRIGDSGGIETTDYIGGAAAVINAANSAVSSALTTAWRMTLQTGASDQMSGVAILSRLTGNSWCIFGAVSPGPNNPSNMHFFAGTKTLSGALTQILIKPEDGASVFDGSGQASVAYI